MIHQIKIIKNIDNIANNHKEKLNPFSFRKRQLCLSMNPCLSTMPIYESKNEVYSETFFSRFFMCHLSLWPPSATNRLLV